MQSVNGTGDVAHLLDVLGVPGLPYQSFQKPAKARPQATSASTSSLRTATAFPLLAAAIPGIAEELLASPVTDNRADPMPPPQAAPLAPFAPPSPRQATPEPVSASVQAEPMLLASQWAAAKPASPPSQVEPLRAEPLRAEPSPASIHRTQIQGVFDMLRGKSLLPPAEATDTRGLRGLFKRQ